MKINELFSMNEFQDPAGDVAAMIADYFISLKASEVQEVSTEAVQQEILKRFGQKLSLEELTALVSDGQLPMVQDITDEKITLDIEDSAIKNKDVEGSGTDVEAMARQATDRAGTI